MFGTTSVAVGGTVTAGFGAWDACRRRSAANASVVAANTPRTTIAATLGSSALGQEAIRLSIGTKGPELKPYCVVKPTTGPASGTTAKTGADPSVEGPSCHRN